MAHVAAVVGAALIQHHQLLRIPDRQLPQHDLIHQGEDGGVGADAQGEREDRDRGEQRASADRAQGKPGI